MAWAAGAIAGMASIRREQLERERRRFQGQNSQHGGFCQNSTFAGSPGGCYGSGGSAGFSNGCHGADRLVGGHEPYGCGGGGDHGGACGIRGDLAMGWVGMGGRDGAGAIMNAGGYAGLGGMGGMPGMAGMGGMAGMAGMGGIEGMGGMGGMGMGGGGMSDSGVDWSELEQVLDRYMWESYDQARTLKCRTAILALARVPSGSKVPSICMVPSSYKDAQVKGGRSDGPSYARIDVWRDRARDEAELNTLSRGRSLERESER
eukprot:2176100-Pleurochrysis_carterae.AAC.2